MSTSLRALIVEDSENDALLVLRELRCGGFDVTWERVETAETMRAAPTSNWRSSNSPTAPARWPANCRAA